MHSQLNWQTLDEDTFQTLVHSRISVERGRSLSSPCQAVCLLYFNLSPVQLGSSLKSCLRRSWVVMQENYVVWMAQPP